MAPELSQSWKRPSRPRPIVIIGAGGIAKAAHLPTYQRIGLPVMGIYDVNIDASSARAREFKIPTVFRSLKEAGSQKGVVYDVAVPAGEILPVLGELPSGAAVLIQKPMGRHLEEAGRILKLCREKKLCAAVNFQLRFSPNMMAIKDALSRALLGDITDIEVRILIHLPWELWAFLKKEDRVEILYHSIHYVDLIRQLLGEPVGVYCRVVGHPAVSEVADTRSTIVLDYGEHIRCSLTQNHRHVWGRKHQRSELKIEGTRGAVVAKMGVNLNYPEGEPDELELITESGAWEGVPLRGSWFTEAFEGPMSNLQRYVSQEDDVLVSGVEDAVKTMALVEACYTSSQRGSTPIPKGPGDGAD